MVISSVLSVDYLVERWPVLFHMAEAGSWESIRRHGLLSTSALLDLFEVDGPRRDEIESKRRSESVEIQHPALGTAWIRDNKPIIESVLRRTLTGMAEEEWYRTLNGRVFFWLSRARLERLRKAQPYRNRKHDILELDTARLLQSHGSDVELSPMNSGATHPAADYPRGAGTFSSIEAYPWAERSRKAPSEPIVELTVRYAVPDISALVLDVYTV